MKIFIGMAAIFMTLAACGTPEGVENGENRSTPDTHYTFLQELPDGSEVLCIWAKTGRGAGLSCDWAGVKE